MGSKESMRLKSVRLQERMSRSFGLRADHRVQPKIVIVAEISYRVRFSKMNSPSPTALSRAAKAVSLAFDSSCGHNVSRLKPEMQKW